jgi:hypothetical protein
MGLIKMRVTETDEAGTVQETVEEVQHLVQARGTDITIIYYGDEYKPAWATVRQPRQALLDIFEQVRSGSKGEAVIAACQENLLRKGGSPYVLVLTPAA